MLEEVLPPGQGQDAGHGLFVTERLTADLLSVFAKEQRSAMRPHFLGNIVTLSGDQPGYAQGSGCCGFYFVLWPIDALADGYCIVLCHIVCGHIRLRWFYVHMSYGPIRCFKHIYGCVKYLVLLEMFSHLCVL
jgi:hypothetical protein